jgi:hypothetical protein
MSERPATLVFCALRALSQHVRLARVVAFMPVVAIAPLCGQDIHPWLAGSGGAIYYNGGNVGIGTASPAAPLHISSYVFGAPSLAYHSGTTMFSLDVPSNVELAIGWLGAAPYGYWIQSRGGGFAQPLSLNPLGGNVGIGTTNPAAKLDTRTGASYQTAAKVSHTGNGDNPGQVLQISNGYGVAAGNYEVMGVYGNNFGTNYFTVKDNGNVGVGTANPTQKLSVNGTVRAKEVVVDTGWADYVFQPAYRVRPLAEVNAYIQQHRRLPDMPSAEEVREKGVGVGEMQVKLLAKIEELTLQMIQMDRQNKELQARLAGLESRIPRAGVRAHAPGF